MIKHHPFLICADCVQCRNRHVKCHESRPVCSTCDILGLTGGGYDIIIFFDQDNTADDNAICFRRPLLTEGERARMSERLTSSVPPNRAFRLLSQIDAECETASASHDFRVFHGPFGAFKLSQHQPVPIRETPSEGFQDSNTPQGLITINNEDLVTPDATLSPWMQDLLHESLGQSDSEHSMPQCLGFLDIPMASSDDTLTLLTGQGRVEEIFDDMVVTDRLPIIPTSSQGNQHSQFSLSNQSDQPWSTTAICPKISMDTNIAVPENTALLLKHYATTVISSLTPFRHGKTPWHVLFLPLAKNCLAALTLDESVDHATACTFYGTLAIGAFSLGAISQSQVLLEQAAACKQQAREHVRLMLTIAYHIPKTAKYKSILMALLTMAQVSMFSGNRGQSECYLLETEKFIRLRGLNRRKSRKVRLLHHCYACMRFFHESTIISGSHSKQRHHVRDAVESSGMVKYSRDGLLFRIKDWNNLDEEEMVVKSQEQGENDLHVSKPGLFSATMYPEIYGIPEPWIFLLSQAIRLGNEKDAAEHDGTENTISLKDFLYRAKAIERRINNMDGIIPTMPTFGNREPIDQDVLETVLHGMQAALAIYFYRRVYDVASSMLQEKVVSVRDWLFRYEHADPTMVFGYVGYMWPAFIAACEAEDQEVQASFSTWFLISTQRSGLPCFTETLKDIERVWQEKRNCNGKSVTWVELTTKHILQT